MHGGEFFFDYSCLPFDFFFPPFIIWEKSEDIEKKTLMVSCVLEKKNNCEKRRKINGVEVVCIITRCWSCGLVKTLMLSRSPVLIWAWRVSGWVRVCLCVCVGVGGGTCILATLAPYLGRIFPTLWHCSHHFEPKDFLFSLPNFFPLSTFGKISFQAEYLSANFTVINATQISKFEREGRSSKYPLPTRGFFLFPSSFPTNDKEDCFVVSCACPSYLYSKNKVPLN